MIDYSGAVRIASGTNAVLGMWLALSAWLYGNADVGALALWNSVAAGIIVAVLAARRYRRPHLAPALSWINMLLGLWILISPWVLGFANGSPTHWNTVIVGLLIAALAIWSAGATLTERRHSHA